MAKITMAFSFDQDKDQDVIKWLDTRGNKSQAIRRAIRDFISANSVSLNDILLEIEDLKRKLAHGATLQTQETTQDGDPLIAQAENALADLGL